MIPLVLAGVGFGIVAYVVDRKLRGKPITPGGLAAAALVAGLTGGVGGAALDALWVAGLFATEGAVAGELEEDVVKPVESFFSGLIHRDHAEPAATPTPTPTPAPTATPTPAPATPDDNTHGGTYVVQPGDTVYSIAKRANVSQSALRGVNSIGPDNTIHVGQRLEIPCPNIDTAGPGAPQSVGCAAAIEKAFGPQNRNPQKAK